MAPRQNCCVAIRHAAIFMRVTSPAYGSQRKRFAPDPSHPSRRCMPRVVGRAGEVARFFIQRPTRVGFVAAMRRRPRHSSTILLPTNVHAPSRSMPGKEENYVEGWQNGMREVYLCIENGRARYATCQFSVFAAHVACSMALCWWLSAACVLLPSPLPLGRPPLVFCSGEKVQKEGNFAPAAALPMRCRAAGRARLRSRSSDIPATRPKIITSEAFQQRMVTAAERASTLLRLASLHMLRIRDDTHTPLYSAARVCCFPRRAVISHA